MHACVRARALTADAVVMEIGRAIKMAATPLELRQGCHMFKPRLSLGFCFYTFPLALHQKTQFSHSICHSLTTQSGAMFNQSYVFIVFLPP
jgi:hypothetical protein